MKVKSLAITTGVIAASVLMFGIGTAQATEIEPAAQWKTIDTADGGTQTTPSANSQIVDATTVDLTWQSGDALSALGTSLETADLNVQVEPGTVVSVNYELLEGASAAAGAVRLFIYDHAGGDTFNESPRQNTPAPAEGTSGTLTIEVDYSGKIGTAGLVYDTSNGGVDGTVRFTDLKIGDNLVLFKHRVSVQEPPTFDYLDCPSNGASAQLVVTEQEGVVYKIGDTVVTTGYALTPGTHTVIATSEPGYEITGDVSWNLIVNAINGCQGPPGTPGEEPTDNPSEEPSATPTETPSESASATETPSATTAPPTSNGGNLPTTGAKLISVGLAGLGMVTVGMIGILWSRRNRDDLMEDVTE